MKSLLCTLESHSTSKPPVRASSIYFAMAATTLLPQASSSAVAALSAGGGTWRRDKKNNQTCSSTSKCGSSFGGTRLATLPWHITQHLHRSKGGKPSGQILVRAKKEIINATKINHLGEHFLDNLSNYIFHQIKRPFAKYIPDDWDPLDFLPVNIQSNLQKSEAIATLVVREALLFGVFYLAYKEVNTFCRWIYRIYTHKQRGEVKEIDEAAYKESPFRAAQAPIRSLIMIWASTRLLQVTAVVWKLQALVTPLVIYKMRAVSVICTTTWFLFRWKQAYAEELIKQRPKDEPRIRAVDKVSTLAMYGLAASCIAEVMDLALRSLFAVGGVSGLAVGLAAKEVVGNMFGGASLFITRPFIIGEKIKAGNVSGHVQDIGFMQTRVQGFDGVPVLVPNQAFTSQVITNFSRAKTKSLEASFQLKNRHMFSIPDITANVEQYLQSQPSVETQKATPICYLKSMQVDGPDIALSCVIKVTGGAAFYKVQQEILIHVAQIITDTLGADSPFTHTPPSPDVHIKSNNEGQPGLIL